MKENFNRNKNKNRRLVLEKIEKQIFWNIETGNKDQSTRDSLRMCSFYAYYNYEILEEIFEYVFGKYGEFDDYLEFIKRRCEALKEKNSPVEKTDEYLRFKEIIEENLEQIIEIGSTRKLKKL